MKNTSSLMRVIAVRWAAYFALWVILIGLEPVDLVVGILTAAVATWTSLRLLPPDRHQLRLAAVPRFALGLMWQSGSAGVDVARRAFSPRLPLQPGFVVYKTQYRRGPARCAFTSFSSLLPGSLPVRDDEQGLLYHCLDVDGPTVEALAADEAAVARVIPR